MRRIVPLTLAALLAAGCSETVGFLSIDLQAKYSPPIACGSEKEVQDPRLASTITLRAVCESGSIQSTHLISEGSASLQDIPLEECTIEVEAANRFGRTVLTGKASATIAEGENEPLQVYLQEQACADPLNFSCDQDQDQLADADEKGLGTDPQKPDSDQDGLEDGVEVMQCCTNPLGPNNKPCSLLIQRVHPGMGPAGEFVMVKASNPLTNPQVSLGNAPLEIPLQDTKTVFGQVSKKATLGEVTVTSGVQKSPPYHSLFAVLRDDPELIIALDQRAGASALLMQEVVDLAYQGDRLFLLGRAGTSTRSVAASVVLVVDRLKKKHTRLVLPHKGSPKALAAGPKYLALLLQDDSVKKATLLFYEQGVGSGLKYHKALSLALPNPVDMMLEPDGTGLLVLFSGHLVRVSLTTLSTSGNTFPLTKKVVFGRPPVGAMAQISGRCTGLDYFKPATAGAGMGTAYLACNINSALCKAGQSCPIWGQLVQVGPVLKCLGNKVPLLPGKDPCWITTTSKAPLPLLGAPAVDSKNKKVYLRTPGFVTYTPLDSTGSQIRTMPLFIAVKWQGGSTAPDQMILDGGGHLFAASGPLVHRLLPQQSSEKLRRGLPFAVGPDQESLMLGLSSDGSLLDVVRREFGSLHSLMSVCLKRCTGCLCPP